MSDQGSEAKPAATLSKAELTRMVETMVQLLDHFNRGENADITKLMHARGAHPYVVVFTSDPVLIEWLLKVAKDQKAKCESSTPNPPCESREPSS